MAFSDLRDFLARLEQEGELLKINEDVDARYEASAALKSVGQAGGPAVYFNQLKGARLPVVGNLFGSVKRLALALECPPDEVNQIYLERREKPIPPRQVPDSPCQEVICRGDEVDLLAQLPLLTYHEKDAGPYITQGLVIVRDPHSEAQSLGIHRIQVKGPRQVCIQLVSHTSTVYRERAEALGKGAEIAIVIGVEPSIMLASMSCTPFSDKLAMAGALRRSPVEICRGLVSQVCLPAKAEIILEGRFVPGVLEEEGPFGESTGYYITSQSPVAKIELVSMRRNAIYAVSEPWTREDEILTSWSWSGDLLNALRKDFPGARALKLSSMMANCVVSLAKSSPGEARRVIYRLLTMNPYLKYVTVVDDDIDIENRMQVDWALTTRMLPDRGIVILQDVDGSPIDPGVKLSPQLLTHKIGFDATRPWGRDEEFAKIDVPRPAWQRAAALLDRYGWKP